LHHRELLGGLARAAWETVRELIVAAAGEDGLRPGMVAVVQTAGDFANWHPHVHVLVSRGGWRRGWEWAPVAYVDEHSAGRSSSPRRFLSLMSAATAPAECARGGGSGTRGRGSRALFRGKPFWPPAPAIQEAVQLVRARPGARKGSRTPC
jgi:hypothetical protein